MIQGVYEIKNRLNGKAYGGSSANIEGRWREHRRMLRNGQHHCAYLQNAWDKYGKDVFEFTILEVIEGLGERLAAEQAWLDEHFAQGTCYNVAITAGPRGPLSGRTRHKMSVAKMGNKNALGYKHTEVARRKMAAAKMGNTLTDEHKQKIREPMKGKQNALGYMATEETRRKLSKALIGNSRAVGNKNRLGKKLTEKSRRKIREAHIGKALTDEHKRKISEGLKQWWARRQAVAMMLPMVLPNPSWPMLLYGGHRK